MEKRKILLSALLFIANYHISNVYAANASDAAITASSEDLFITVTNLDGQTETTVEKGVKHYAKLFVLTVYNNTDKPLSLATKGGCFKAEDEDGKISITQKIVDPDLIKVLSPNGENRGYVIFSTKDSSVLKTRYVIWSKDCTYHKRNGDPSRK